MSTTNYLSRLRSEPFSVIRSKLHKQQERKRALTIEKNKSIIKQLSRALQLPGTKSRTATEHCNNLANKAYGKTEGRWCYKPYTENGEHEPFLPWGRERAAKRKAICSRCENEVIQKIDENLGILHRSPSKIRIWAKNYDDQKYIDDFAAIKKNFI
jgi:hypothetical protein